MYSSSLVRLFVLPVALALGLFLISSTMFEVDAAGPGSGTGPPKALQWGDKCKNAPNLKPTEECDILKGLLCQRYEQGHYCGCQIDGPLSYDRQSKECRRKVMSVCYYDSEADILNTLPFNQKCHEWAECIKPNWTAITGKSKPDETMICQCRDGYLPTKDFSECNPIKRSTSGATTSLSLSLALVIPITLILIALL